MRRSYEQALERAQECLRRLETYREDVRSNSGVLHNPDFLERRIEAARRCVAELRQAVEEAKAEEGEA